MFNKVVIVIKGVEKARWISRRLREWLKNRGMEVEVFENVAETMDWFPQPKGFSEDVGLVMVLGGDGTLLSAARQVGKANIPILGVNLGGVGFITEIGLDQVYETLELFLEDKLACEDRLMLEGTVIREKKEIYTCHVLNDVVINKGALARIIDIHTQVNGKFLNVFRADGLIVSTPTGSTAYNLAAGGPILHPAMISIVLTPICPFMLTNRPIILPGESVVELEIGTQAEDVTLTYDGQVGFDLNPHDVVRVQKADSKICLVKSPSKDYFEMLRNKLKWGER